MRTKLEPCHPRIVRPGCTCYSMQQLQMIASSLRNAGHEITNDSSREGLWKNIDKVMRQSYQTEFDWAWRDTPPVKALKDHQLMHQTFRPRAPKEWTLHVQGGKSRQGRFVWLSNFDIDAVLKQYTSLTNFQDFRFFKSAAIDFEDIKDPLSRVNPVVCRRKGINRIAAVINLDKHDQPGSHWVCLVANFQTGVVAFFDSYATLPEKEIVDFMARLSVHAMTGFDGKHTSSSDAFLLVPLYNVTRFQRGSSACGAFCIYIVISFLLSDGTREAFSRICSIVVDDASMTDFKRSLFVDDGFRVTSEKSI